MRKHKFQSIVYDHYRVHGRLLPWRETEDPYRILVSELMLQQTQVQRVVGKYSSFLKKFPTIRSVADAPLRSILDTWSGLGYNRRALAFKKLATIIVEQFRGKVPDTVQMLTELPGVGTATANAVCAFAFNKPVVFLETNIRTVFLHHFFEGQEQVKDSHILPLVEKMLDTTNPRKWYYALMDYGVFLKRRYGNPARRSAHYKKQSGFAGSDRQIRGGIIRMLVRSGGMSAPSLLKKMPFPAARVKHVVERLVVEGLIDKHRGRISIAGHT